MAISLEKYIHLLGVNTLTGLLTYIGIAWGIAFLLILLLIFPLIELGIISPDALPGIIAFSILAAFVAGVLALFIPAKIKQEDIEKNFPVFLAFLGSMTTAKTNYDEFFKTLAETEEYGEISKEMKRLYHLAKDWKLGYAKACKVVADTTPSKIFSDFLARLAQVVEYGEDITFFFETQFRDIMRDMQTSYQEAVYKISSIADLFSALFVSMAFLMAFAVMMPIFFPIDYTSIAIGSAIGFLAIDVLLVTLTRAAVPTDKLSNKFPDTCPEHTLAILATFIGILASILFFLAAWVLGLPPILQVGLAAVPLIVPGILAYRAEKIIRRREESYIPFIRTLGDLTSIREGAITPVLKRLRRHSYPGLNEAISRLYKRLSITRNVHKAFDLFSKEIGSALISKFNELFVKALYAGADPRKTGAIIGDQMHAILESRRLRLQVAAGARGTLYGSFFGVALGVLLAVKSLAHVFSLFTSVLAQAGESVAGYFTFLNFNVNLYPLIDIVVYLFAVEAAVLAVIIKMIDGGLMSDATRHFVILTIGLVIVYYVTDWAISFLVPAAGNAAQIEVPGVASP